MRIDSQEYRISWFGAMAALLAQCIFLSVFRNFYLGVAFFSLGMILLNVSILTEKVSSRVCAVLLMVLEAGAVVYFPRWYMGVLSLLVIGMVWLAIRPVRRALGILLALGGLILHILTVRPDAVSALIYSGFTLLFYIIWETVFFFFDRSIETHDKLDKALTAAAVEALEQRSLREEIAKNQKLNENNARLEERERISRDIHNYVGHTLSAATVTLDAATMLVPSDQEKALEKIDAANSRVHEAISSVRSVVRTLDAEDDRIALDDYLESLEKMVDEFKSDTSYKVYHNFSQVKSKTRIPIQTASFLSSSISELLTNGVKHGKADLFVITFVLDENHIRLKVQDNGTGWGKITLNEKKLRLNNGFGLRKIRDYTENCGGSFEIESEDGFTVSLSLPFEGEEK